MPRANGKAKTRHFHLRTQLDACHVACDGHGCWLLAFGTCLVVMLCGLSFTTAVGGIGYCSTTVLQLIPWLYTALDSTPVCYNSSSSLLLAMVGYVDKISMHMSIVTHDRIVQCTCYVYMRVRTEMGHGKFGMRHALGHGYWHWPLQHPPRPLLPVRAVPRSLAGSGPSVPLVFMVCAMCDSLVAIRSFSACMRFMHVLVHMTIMHIRDRNMWAACALEIRKIRKVE